MCNKANYLLALLALAAMLFGACKEPPPDPPDDEPSEYFIKVNVNTTEVFLEDQKDGFLVGSTQEKDHVVGDGHWHLGTVWGHISGNQSLFQINFHNYYFGPEEISDQDFEAIWQTGSYDPLVQDSVPGVNVIYKDGNGKWWSSEYGQQDNWAFNLTTSEKIEGGLTPNQKIGGTFSCTVWDTSGNSVVLSGGEFMGRVTAPN